MRIRCPRCGTEFESAEEDHYRELDCPGCGSRFQAISDATRQVGQDYLDELLKERDEKPE